MVYSARLENEYFINRWFESNIARFLLAAAAAAAAAKHACMHACMHAIFD